MNFVNRGQEVRFHCITELNWHVIEWKAWCRLCGHVPLKGGAAAP